FRLGCTLPNALFLRRKGFQYGPSNVGALWVLAFAAISYSNLTLGAFVSRKFMSYSARQGRVAVFWRVTHDAQPQDFR
ncbi:hypothetical protein RA276_32895, partial [Pseudomonas syringae pv. tagetis]|uniref:hypothetical protein n=1 Tax=Pseudomonas syringae group genomosp. 7 TaxID=251699 RepID=UPI0037705D5A